MPYIDEKKRSLARDGKPKDAGELNYLITTTLLKYLEEHGKNYQIINEIMGALECAKTEFYRRIVVPYEDIKKEDNGDIYQDNE